MTLPILDLRDRALLGRDLVVSAGAGSGKTFTLSVLVAGALGRGPWRPQDVLATTFSEAAATDLRARLLRPLEVLARFTEAHWAEGLPLLRQGEEAFAAWLEALPAGDAKARTEVRWASGLWMEADGKAPSWMRSPAEARLHWRRTRREAELLQVGTLHSLALSLLGQAGAAPREVVEVRDPSLLRLLRREVRAFLEAQPEALAPFVTRLQAWVEGQWATLSELHDHHRDAMGLLRPVDPSETLSLFETSLDRWMQQLLPFFKEELPIGKTKQAKASRVIALGPPPEALGPRLRWAQRVMSETFRDQVPKASYTDAFKTALEGSTSVVAAFETMNAALVEGALVRFQAVKEQRRLATFGDLVRMAVDGLSEGRITPPKPPLLLVDEVQDVSPAQDALLSALQAAHTLRVGDLKQAIYGFRGGDPELLRQRLQEAKSTGGALRLPANHRSRAPIVDLANALVTEVWPTVDAESAPEDAAQDATRAAEAGVALIPREGKGSAQDLLGFTDWIAPLSRPEGWTSLFGEEDRGPRRRALLLQRRTRLPRLRLLLHRLGVDPFVLSSEGFWDSPGVRLLRAALAYATNPEAPLPRAVLLRQWMGLSDGEITARMRSESRMPDPAAEDGFHWVKGLNGLGTRDLVGLLLAEGPLWSLLQATAAHGVQEPLRARRNLEAFVIQLLALPDAPASALAMLDERAKGSPRGDVPTEPEGADLLIQTVHASKGLEYEDVILPCLDPYAAPLRNGAAGADAEGRFRQGWRLGGLDGPALASLKAQAKAKRVRDDLNLFYVALTRARDRLVMLASGKPQPQPGWHAWAKALGERAELPSPERPALAPLLVSTTEPLIWEAPPHRALPPPPLVEAEEDEASRQRRMLEGDLMHAYLRDLLLRWEDPTAFEACLQAAPPVAQARDQALQALATLEARGWRHLPRRTELPLAGTAASGALGRADLVIWEPDRRHPTGLHLIDFKHSSTFDAAALAAYRAQLARYASALQVQAPVSAWLLALRSGELVQIDF